jgi:CubicO group peptidase (beta-lactamase class C family)
MGSGVVPSLTCASPPIAPGKQSDNFDQKILAYMEEGHMPSLVACIVKNNTTVWSHAYGKYRYYQNKTATEDIIYPIGCITKSFIATAIMQLNETGNLSLDDNVSKYLNFDLKNPRYPTVNITFRMLLAHQSSLANPYQRFVFYFFWLHYPMDRFRDYFVPGGKIYSEKVWNDYPPGHGVCYASTDFNILGYIIQRISGQTLEDYFQEHIFGPLSMTNTSFYFSTFNKNRICGLYSWIANVYIPLPIREYGLVASGGIKSTIVDMSHFLIMHASRGVYNGTRILKNESVEEMHKIQYPGYNDSQVQHGLGWYTVNISGVTYGGHRGGYVGAPALMRLRYSDHVGIMVMWNQNSYILESLNKSRTNEENALAQIAQALYEKADEL